MLKAIIIGSVLVAAALAARFDDFDNNLIEYDVSVPVREVSLPYPYQEIRQERTKPAYYENYDTIVVPAAPVAVGLSKLGLVAFITSYAFKCIKKAITFLMFNGAALALGSIVAISICKLTPICSKLGDVKSLLEAEQEFRSFATPERLAGAADFVQKALRKYRSLQD